MPQSVRLALRKQEELGHMGGPRRSGLEARSLCALVEVLWVSDRDVRGDDLFAIRRYHYPRGD